MKQFYIFTVKEFYHIFRDRWTTMMILALPILMIVLFGFGISTEIKNARFSVYDPTPDEASKELVRRLNTSEYFSLKSYLDNPGDIEKVFKEGDVGLVVVIENSFYENLLHTGKSQIQLIADGTDPNTASTLTSYASRLILAYQQELVRLDQIPYLMHTEVKLLYNPTMKGVFNTVPGVMGMILMLICAMMTSVSIARERETGTMEVLLVSPLKPFLLILSKVVPYFVLSMINFTTILLLSRFLLNVPINGNLFLMYFVAIIFVFVSLSLGLLISSSVSTQLVALLVSVMGLMLPTILLSGLMFPIESMPIPLQVIAQAIPAKWFIEAMRDIMIKGLGIQGVLKEMGVLSLMAVALIALSLKKFKIRLE